MNTLKGLYNNRVCMVMLSDRRRANCDSQLINGDRWIALENQDGTFTWIDQWQNTTQRIDKSILQGLLNTLNQNTSNQPSLNQPSFKGGPDVSIH